MKISVIDDIYEDRENACSLVREYLRSHGLTAEITDFSCAEDFLASEERFDIAFLDIFMDGINGIDAARRIRKTNSDMELIFLTTSRDFAVEAFSVSAAHYLVKPFSQEGLFAALDKVTRKKAPEPSITIRCNNGLQTFALRDVEFFEVQEHNLYINLSDGKKLTARMAMKQLRDKITENKDYMPCGSSFLVNLRCVVSLDNLVLTTKAGRKIPIPRRCVPEIEKAYLNYCRKTVIK